MKRFLLPILVLSASLLAQQTQAPAPAAQPKFELETFYMAIMHRASSPDEAKSQSLRPAHLQYWQTIADRGDLIAAGPLSGGEGNVVAAAIYRAADARQAEQVLNDDPLTKAQIWTVEIHPWMTGKGVLPAIHPSGPRTNYYLGFLVRGPKFSPEDSPERQRIQQAHLANIKRLADMGKLIAAGPFAEDINLRGIFVFKTGSRQEAEELTNTDPAVQAGRLRIELYEWNVPAEAFSKK
jgi:uncharacterized protein YciI